jgi:predicted membrane metal-binding protein
MLLLPNAFPHQFLCIHGPGLPFVQLLVLQHLVLVLIVWPKIRRVLSGEKVVVSKL